MCPRPIFWKIISLTTCCVLGGPLNVSYLREPPHCFVEDTSSRQMSDGLTPAAVVVTFFLLSPHVRMLLSVLLINIGGIFILSQVRSFWRIYAINLKRKNHVLTLLWRLLFEFYVWVLQTTYLYFPKFMPVQHLPFSRFPESTIKTYKIVSL